MSLGRGPASSVASSDADVGHASGGGEIRPAMMGGGKGAESVVEERIGALAEALDMPSRDLAFAIADGVREHVPPASLLSVKEHQTGYALNFFFRVSMFLGLI